MCEVVLHLGLRADELKRAPQNRGSSHLSRKNQAIVHPLSLPASGDQSETAEVRKMARNLRLAEPQYFRKIADADFAAVD